MTTDCGARVSSSATGWTRPRPPTVPRQAQTYPEIVATAYFARSARIVAEAAALLGREDDAARYGALADEVRRRSTASTSPDRGASCPTRRPRTRSRSQFDLIRDPRERQHAADRLAQIVAGERVPDLDRIRRHPARSADALSANGHADVAYRLLLQTESPSWLYAVEHGGDHDLGAVGLAAARRHVNPSGMTSFNHYAFGAVADWMHRVVAGLAPAAPGYRRLRIAPQPPRRGLTTASARLDTPYGEASSAWTLDDGMLRLAVAVPVGATAEVVLPSGIDSRGRAGTHRSTSRSRSTPRPPGAVTSIPAGRHHRRQAGDGRPHRGDRQVHPRSGRAHVRPAFAARRRSPRDRSPGCSRDPTAVLADLERGFAAVIAGETIPLEVITRTAADRRRGCRPDGEGRAAERAATSGPPATATASASIVHGRRPARRAPAGRHRRQPRIQREPARRRASRPASRIGIELGSRARSAKIGVALGEEARALDVDVHPRAGDQHQAIAARRPHLRVLLGGPAAHRRPRHRLRAGRAEHRSRHLAQALRREQPGDRPDARRAQVDDRALREIYLPAFERVVKEAAPTSVMSAYNAINGVFASENRWLLTELLRDEWGFDGLVVSDWGAIKDRVEALDAGLDLEMPGTGDEGTAAILDAVRDRAASTGRWSSASVARLAQARRAHRRGRARPTGPSTSTRTTHSPGARPRHPSCCCATRTRPCRSARSEGRRHRRARRSTRSTRAAAARTSTRHGSTSRSTSCAQPSARRTSPTRAGYAKRSDADAEALLREARRLGGGVRTSPSSSSACTRRTSPKDSTARPSICPPRTSPSSRRSRPSPARTVVVLSNGGVVHLEPWHDSVDAIVEGLALGQAVGGALADILTGAVNPTGRLAETIPLAAAGHPVVPELPRREERVALRRGRVRRVPVLHHRRPGRAVPLRSRSQLHDVHVRGPRGHGDRARHGRRPRHRAQHRGGRRLRSRADLCRAGALSGAPPDARARRVREGAPAARGARRRVEIALDRRAFAFWDTDRAPLVGRARHVRGRGRAVGDRRRVERRVTLEGDSERARAARPSTRRSGNGSGTRSSARR